MGGGRVERGGPTGKRETFFHARGEAFVADFGRGHTNRKKGVEESLRSGEGGSANPDLRKKTTTQWGREELRLGKVKRRKIPLQREKERGE